MEGRELQEWRSKLFSTIILELAIEEDKVVGEGGKVDQDQMHHRIMQGHWDHGGQMVAILDLTPLFGFGFCAVIEVSKGAKIRNRYNQVPHLTQDTNGKVTNSQKTPQTLR